MALEAHNARSDSAQDAYEAYAATQRMARDNPALLTNEYFKALQDTAYARFLIAYSYGGAE